MNKRGLVWLAIRITIAILLFIFLVGLGACSFLKHIAPDPAKDSYQDLIVSINKHVAENRAQSAKFLNLKGELKMFIVAFSSKSTELTAKAAKTNVEYYIKRPAGCPDSDSCMCLCKDSEVKYEAKTKKYTLSCEEPLRCNEKGAIKADFANAGSLIFTRETNPKVFICTDDLGDIDLGFSECPNTQINDWAGLY